MKYLDKFSILITLSNLGYSTQFMHKDGFAHINIASDFKFTVNSNLLKNIGLSDCARTLKPQAVCATLVRSACAHIPCDFSTFVNFDYKLRNALCTCSGEFLFELIDINAPNRTTMLKCRSVVIAICFE